MYEDGSDINWNFPLNCIESLKNAKVFIFLHNLLTWKHSFFQRIGNFLIPSMEKEEVCV